MTHAHDQRRHVAIVTGANHGIGEATARVLASVGCAVLVTYFRTSGHEHESATYRENRSRDGQSVAALINNAGGKAIAEEIDLTEPDAVRAFVQENPEFLHVASPADVAEVISWLCSDAARMVTGNIVRMR